ncbi:Uncharacterised protein [Vibrio cholerae]|nr:Uncharacterised protein [Vibrio cholerae]
MLLTLSVKMISKPGQSTALARKLLIRRDTEKFGESKYLVSGQKWTLVPVLRRPQVPVTVSSVTLSPCSKAISYT